MADTFIHDDFILYTPTAVRLYHEAAENEPVIDFHNHLNPREIYEDKSYADLTEVWLGGDHYKWRAMRANGVPEELITGKGEAFEKFKAWADTVQNCFGNPLYHWTHLELKRYFDIDKTLDPGSAEEIWKTCNEMLRAPEFTARNLLLRQNVSVLCTTDDPADDLKWHKAIRDDGFEIRVLPSFRPGGALDIEKESFASYMKKLGEAAGVTVDSPEALLDALKKRLDYFMDLGCRVTDHSLESDFYREASEDEIKQIFGRGLAGKLEEGDAAAWRGWLLTELGREYARRGLVMQLHIGAIRNNSTRMYSKLGADAGFDSLNDFNYAPQLSGILDAMDAEGEVPRTIFYYLNPKDGPMLAAMAGNYQSNDEGIRGKMQLGSGWWFCDHLRGMEQQMDTLSDVGLLSTFVGMLTDSRSFLSFPRHEYFRRILCNKIGETVDKGQYPCDMEYLTGMVRGICGQNAVSYFNF